jgi:cation diffusion facilitator CzcD-associated flavoprotein CzcO
MVIFRVCHYVNHAIQIQVKLVTPLAEGKWEVSVRDLSSAASAVTSDRYEAVIVCNGHYSIPSYADVKNMDDFRGRIVHSHDYRVPEEFEGKNVLLLGASSSGQGRTKFGRI